MNHAATSLSKKTIILHWVVALGMIGLLAAGLYMEQFKAYWLYPIHKSFGVIIFAFIAVRVINRILEGWPENISKGAQWEHILAKIIHWALILGTIIMPISGMMMSGLGGHGIHVFGIELMARNHDPVSGETVPINGFLAGLGAQAHDIAGKILLGAIALHLLGALKHHVLDKDATLRRMLGMPVKQTPPE